MHWKKSPRCTAPVCLVLIGTWLTWAGESAWGQSRHPRSEVPSVYPASAVENASGQNGVAEGPGEPSNVLDLADQPLESLTRQDVVVPAMDVEVSTVSRTESTVGRSPAAV